MYTKIQKTYGIKLFINYYILPRKPTLHEQLDPDRLNLFQNGVT